MKQIIFIIAGLMILSTTTMAQTNTNTVVAEVKIKTSAVCDMCKKRIEDGLYTQKGIIEATLNLDTKVVTVKYRNNKTTEEKIRTFISSLGYNADTIVADKTAFDQLPACCQSESNMH